MEKLYFLVKEKVNNSANINFKLIGYEFKPKQEINYPIKIESVILVKPSLIEKVLKLKTKKKLNFYLQYIIMLLDESDDDSEFERVLDSVERYKSILKSRYRKYLDDKYIDLLLRKITLLEKQAKEKMEVLNFSVSEKVGKSR